MQNDEKLKIENGKPKNSSWWKAWLKKIGDKLVVVKRFGKLV